MADAITSGQRSKKGFIETGIPTLYWYEVISAMICPGKKNKTFVCPCRIKGTDIVLVWILRTRCNKPRYDCLVYDVRTDKAYVVNALGYNWEHNYECDETLEDFDIDRMSR